STLSPSGVNYEVVALISIKGSLNDPYNALESWDVNSVDPCSWRTVTCSPDGFVSALGLTSLSLSGTISTGIENLTNVQSIVLQNNEISGQIPDVVGKLEKLQTLDLSSNSFSGRIPNSLGDLKNLKYLRLNNNSLTGHIPTSLSLLRSLTVVDVSFNNLSGSLPKVSSKTFKVVGNPLICGLNSSDNCSAVYPEPVSFSSTDTRKKKGRFFLSFNPPSSSRFKQWLNHHHVYLCESESSTAHVIAAFAASFSVAFLCLVGLFFVWYWWWRCKRNSGQIFFDVVNDHRNRELRLGHLRMFSFKELKAATDHFDAKNILGRGGFGIVYKGRLRNGTEVAVKRLHDLNSAGGKVQFQTEVELISLAVHRNLLRLWGFCSTDKERLLIYPYMPNGSVASRLGDRSHGRPVLDWPRRKRIAVGTARGLVYLHEQCDPKIIHRDVKAANILLDEDFEAVVGDFGLAKLLDHRDSHVTTAVRGTVGHIAPEYLSTGQSSEKTDVFGFGILLLELITGQRAVDFGRGVNEKGLILDWVRRLQQEGDLDLIADKDLKKEYDAMELVEMARVALLCTHFNPAIRPKMSEVLRMLEGDGLAEKWEQSLDIESPPRQRSFGFPPEIRRYSDFIEESSLVDAMELSGPR
ncbi:hypothetical protein M569_01245, partial [Genlisea aurea]